MQNVLGALSIHSFREEVPNYSYPKSFVLTLQP